MENEKLLIGIDPGIHTGLAYKNIKSPYLTECLTLKIHEAFDQIKEASNLLNVDLYIIVEDARQRKWYGKNSYEKQQGAGAIKVQCSQWEDFLTDLCKYRTKVKFKMVKPIKGGTKMNEKIFKQITKFKGRTSEHARDAAMLIWGLHTSNIDALFTD